MTIAVLIGCSALCQGAPARGQAKTRQIPPLSQIAEATQKHFQKLPGYQPGDLITQADCEPLLAELERLGLPLDRKQLLARITPEGDFLVGTLRTPAGRKFMRQIAGYPEAYDRLDRLSRLPHGKRTVEDLIRGPGGYKMLEYLTTTRGGAETGKMLSHARKGAEFNEPTGRVYTAEALLAELKKIHAAAQKKSP